MPNHHHRAGSLRQSNKRNKRSKASKRSVSRATGGRVNVKQAAAAHSSSKTKADRRHHLKQKRDASRLAVLQKKRGVSSSTSTPPRVIGIISLGEDAGKLEDKLLSLLVKKADKNVPSGASGVTAKYNVHKKEGNVTYLSCSRAFGIPPNDDAAVMAALDLVRICDMVLFVIDGDGTDPDVVDPLGMKIATGYDEASHSSTKSTVRPAQDWDHLISERGDRILAAVKGQGLPTPLTILARTAKDDNDDAEDYMTMQSAKSVRRSAMKKHHDLKRYVGRFATTEFGAEHDKVVEVDLTVLDEGETMEENHDVEDGAQDRQKQVASDALVRTLCTVAVSPPKWVADAPRAYVIADKQEYNTETQELRLTGHVRGKVPFNVNSLIHVPSVGTFACKSVQKATPPLAKERKAALVAMEEDKEILFSDPTKRESLEIFATPDALDGEQNLVGFDDFHEEYRNDDAEEEAMKRPAGWSDYQSAWFDAVDDLAGEEEGFDHGELADELNRKKPSQSGSASIATDAMDWDDDNGISKHERASLLAQRRKDQKEELEFPDEVEIDEETNARDRFARYRSLKSFRKSFWDPKENLPDSYGSIYHFSSFKATQRDVFSEMKEVAAAANAAGDFWGRGNADKDIEQSMKDNNDDEDNLLDGCVPSGSYVTITLEGVKSLTVSPDATLVAVGLLPHENKVSVLHMGLCQTAKCDKSIDAPVKSKDVLTFRCGWRTWKGRPVFSQNNLNSDKHKFERFLPQEGAFFAASVFGPVTYTPCPVLVFREDGTPVETNESHSRDLVSIGSIFGADADRITVKRIILTGYPTRVHKRHATVKYMFYNPDDVRWFKPAGLSTKRGLHGHIVQSVGEHGTMKCLFNAPIKQHDTVILPLYKRIFPKYPPSSSDDNKTELVVL
jgi:pre-rRNA-processing protein TSR1